MLEMQKNNQTIQLRNLQEQVQKNKIDIANHYARDKVLADFGIKIIGTLLSPPIDAGTSYGDAYLVGIEPPYDIYVWSRADENSGHYEDYWLNLGAISIQGAQGEPGPQGPKGDPGMAPTISTGVSPKVGSVGDLFIVLAPGSTINGNLYQTIDSLSGPMLSLKGNIQGPQGIQGYQGIQGPVGPQGPQGPKGDTGDVGGFINIVGILDNINILPAPESLDNLTQAYLVGQGTTESPYNLYIQIGETSDTAIWENVGPLNVATYVTSNGLFQNVWNSDVKLDKITSSGNTGEYRLYGIDSSGNQMTLNTRSDLVQNTIPIRDGNGSIVVPADPINFNDATSKEYVDNKLNLKQNKLTNNDGTISLVDSGNTTIISSNAPVYSGGTGISIDSNNVITNTAPISRKYLHNVTVTDSSFYLHVVIFSDGALPAINKATLMSLLNIGYNGSWILANGFVDADSDYNFGMNIIDILADASNTLLYARGYVNTSIKEQIRALTFTNNLNVNDTVITL